MSGCRPMLLVVVMGSWLVASVAGAQQGEGTVDGDGATPATDGVEAVDGQDAAAPVAPALPAGTWTLSCEHRSPVNADFLRAHGSLTYKKQDGEVNAIWAGLAEDGWWTGLTWAIKTGKSTPKEAKAMEGEILDSLAGTINMQSPSWIVYLVALPDKTPFMATVEANAQLSIRTGEQHGVFDVVVAQGIPVAMEGGVWSYTFDNSLIGARRVASWGGNTDKCSLNGVVLPDDGANPQAVDLVEAAPVEAAPAAPAAPSAAQDAGAPVSP